MDKAFKKKKISIVLSLYNEAEGINYFWSLLEKELHKLSSLHFELLWINDGSKDDTQKLLDAFINNSIPNNISHVRIQFSRNFGHESAMIAGIDNATGEAIICMDSDGQHPPKSIHELINAFEEGNDIVLTERIQREDHNVIKKSFSTLFYKLINSLSDIHFHKNSTDFFLISSQISLLLKENFRDQTRFIRGFIQALGYKKTTLKFKAPSRLHGQSNYSYWSLLKLAINAIFSFSSKPLRISIGLSFLFTFFTLIIGGYTLYKYFSVATIPDGYTTIMIFLSASFSVLFISLAIISLYFEKLIQEVRKRPIYIIKKKITN